MQLLRVPREVTRALRLIESQTAVESGRVEGVAFVTASAYRAVANLSELESRLVMRSPVAEARLRFIGDTGTARIAEILGRSRL